MNISVNSCYDCPFCNNDQEEGSDCNFPGIEVSHYEVLDSCESKVMPLSCPLRFGTITVSASIINLNQLQQS